jgi:hypothetical protein
MGQIKEVSVQKENKTLPKERLSTQKRLHPFLQTKKQSGKKFVICGGLSKVSFEDCYSTYRDSESPLLVYKQL